MINSIMGKSMKHPSLGHLPPSSLRAYPGNARTHSKKQIKQIAASIREFGFTNPVLISDDDEIIAGHGRVLAAISLGMETVPTIRLSHLTKEQRRAYVLADNKLALNASWDQELLAMELQGLLDLEVNLGLTGFSQAEIDLTLDFHQLSDPKGRDAKEDQIPSMACQPITKSGDLWVLGRHRLLCADARDPASYVRLLDGELADLVFTDPPYNVPIDGHVCGLGRIRHREFAMGVGEMSEEAFALFLQETLGAMAKACRDGAIAFVCMDWRHMGELFTAGGRVFNELKNVCVWNKTNGGMGSFYRSKHEMICVFKVGDGAHTNNFGLGQEGRYRTNVWDYPGVSGMGAKNGEVLAMHPTVKPTALVADAIRDCTKRGAIVLDGFGGSGTTLVAAQGCGRSARLIEIDPLYCDVIIRRFEQLTGKSAMRQDGLSFEAAELEAELEKAHG